MKMSDSEVTLGELLTARAVDVLEMLLWIKTKDGAKNRNRPKPVLDALFPKKKDDGNKVTSFRTVEDFENARNKILGSQGG